MERSRSTSAASSGRSAGAWWRCSSRSCATRSTRPRRASPRRSPPTSCRSRRCSSSRGTIGERIGRRRVVRTGYITYAILSALAAFAPSLGAFLVVRALQGSANAFLTPLLLAGLADEVAAAADRPRGGDVRGRADRRGRARAARRRRARARSTGGSRSSASPWSRCVARADAARRRRQAQSEAPRLRAVFTRRVGLLSGAAFTAYAGVTGVGFLVAVLAADEFDLGSVLRGVLLAGFGVAGMLVGRRERRRRGSLRPRAGGAGRDRDLRGARRAASASRRAPSCSARCGSRSASARR